MERSAPSGVIAVHFVVGPRDAAPGFAAHWSNAGTARLSQVDQIIRWVSAEETPTFVAGDFNMPARGLAYRRLTGAMRSGFADAGLGFGSTYPSRRPLLRIDHIFSANGPPHPERPRLPRPAPRTTGL